MENYTSVLFMFFLAASLAGIHVYVWPSSDSLRNINAPGTCPGVEHLYTIWWKKNLVFRTLLIVTVVKFYKQ